MQTIGKSQKYAKILASILFKQNMSLMSKVALVKEMIDSAEKSLLSAKRLLYEITGTDSSRAMYSDMASELKGPQLDGESKVIEGVFNGEKMVGSDKNEYPIPANYCSKSKLVPGDVLKLTIESDGTFRYKQIAPVERLTVMGVLTKDNNKYKVLAAGKLYSVLLASITYYKGHVGDQVVLLVPALEETEWGAIDAIIPQAGSDNQALIQDSDDDLLN